MVIPGKNKIDNFQRSCEGRCVQCTEADRYIRVAEEATLSIPPGLLSFT